MVRFDKHGIIKTTIFTNRSKPVNKRTIAVYSQLVCVSGVHIVIELGANALVSFYVLWNILQHNVLFLNNCLNVDFAM